MIVEFSLELNYGLSYRRTFGEAVRNVSSIVTITAFAPLFYRGSLRRFSACRPLSSSLPSTWHRTRVIIHCSHHLQLGRLCSLPSNLIRGHASRQKNLYRAHHMRDSHSMPVFYGGEPLGVNDAVPVGRVGQIWRARCSGVC